MNRPDCVRGIEHDESPAHEKDRTVLQIRSHDASLGGVPS